MPATSKRAPCLARSDDFPGITLTLTPGGTIAGQTEFAKTNFNIDIVPLDGADGFYAGEGNSVYWEGNGNLYQASASLSGDGDARVASLDLLRLGWVPDAAVEYGTSTLLPVTLRSS